MPKNVTFESEKIELAFVTPKPFYIKRVVVIDKSNGNLTISDYDRVDNSLLGTKVLNIFDVDIDNIDINEL